MERGDEKEKFPDSRHGNEKRTWNALYLPTELASGT